MFPSTPKMMRPPKITPSRMALETFTGAGGWVQLALSEAFPERNTMVPAGSDKVRLSALEGHPRAGAQAGAGGAGSQKVSARGSLARWGWLGVRENPRMGSNPGQHWKRSEGHAKGQGIKGNMARVARSCPRTLSNRCAGPRPQLPPFPRFGAKFEKTRCKVQFQSYGSMLFCTV